MQAGTETIFGALLVLAQLVNGVAYGPSLEYLTSENDFSNGVGQKRIIKLADYAPTYSVVVPLARNKTTAEPHLLRPVGEFAIEAPENMRVMAVIQSLHLRKKSFTSAFPPVCRDYIVFGDDHINKLCGDVVKSDRKGAPIGMMGDRTFFSPSNILNVTIYTDVSTFVETWMNIPNTVEIAFTAYQSCPFYDPDEYLFNCLDNIIPYGPSCISSNLTCDGVVNCGFLSDGTYGKDEADCPNNINSSSLNENVPSINSGGSTSRPTLLSSTVSSDGKTSFPSWWDNWRKMQLDEPKNNLNLLNLGGDQYVVSDKTNTADGSSGHPTSNRGDDLYNSDIRRTTHYFDPEYKSSVNYFNSFALYALCFYAGVSGIFVILKVAMRYCSDDSASSVRSTSNLMRDSSSSFSVANESDGGSPMSIRSHPADGFPFAIPRNNHFSPPDVRDFELPPSYESLFPNGPRQDCLVVDLSAASSTTTLSSSPDEVTLSTPPCQQTQQQQHLHPQEP